MHFCVYSSMLTVQRLISKRCTFALTIGQSILDGMVNNIYFLFKKLSLNLSMFALVKQLYCSWLPVEDPIFQSPCPINNVLFNEFINQLYIFIAAKPTSLCPPIPSLASPGTSPGRGRSQLQEIDYNMFKQISILILVTRDRATPARWCLTWSR